MITKDDGSVTISSYTDGFITKKTYVEAEISLQARFTNWNDQFSFLMLSLLKKKNFTNQRFIDAAEFVIENEKFPTITPAAILNFDKCLDLKTNLQIREKMKEFGNSIWEFYDAVDVNGTCMYCEVGKMDQFGIHLPEWKAENYKPIEPLTDKMIEAAKETFDFKKFANNFEAKKKPAKKSKYQGMKLSPDEIVAEAKKREKEKL